MWSDQDRLLFITTPRCLCFRSPCHVNWLLYVTIKERKLKYKTNQFLNVQLREGDIFHDQSSFVLWTVFFSFFLFFIFITMAPQVLEKKIALLFTYRKIEIIFKSIELEHTPSNFPQSKRWSATVQSQKKKAALVGFIHDLHSQRDHHSKNNKRRSRVNNLNKFAYSLTSRQSSRTKCFSLRELKAGSSILDYFYAVAGRNLEACLAA